MTASDETAAILGIWSLPEFKSAVDQAIAQMEPSERVLCAGLAGWAASETERPAADHPTPYYAVTTDGVHYGILTKKKGFLSSAVTENRFVPMDAIAHLPSDFATAVDLRSANDSLLANLIFRDSLGYQFVRLRDDPSPMHAGHHHEPPTAQAQLRNLETALGKPLGS